LDELREYASDVMLRRTKKDSIDLPQKTIKPVYLPLEYSTSYNAYIAEYEQWIEDMAAMGEKPSVTDHLTKLIKVRQLLSNDKIEHTIKLAEDLIENEHKVIIFSCFTQTINAIHEHFGKASVLIDGSVSKEKRQLAVDRFQTDDKIKVFCGNIVAAGVGLTLTEGTIVIFNDLDWTPANHAQAEDRAHRIGQENDVHIIYPLFDETLDTIMFGKKTDKLTINGKLKRLPNFGAHLVEVLGDAAQGLRGHHPGHGEHGRRHREHRQGRDLQRQPGIHGAVQAQARAREDHQGHRRAARA
jgi:SWI/SNF-related matrix-associated actin-dependent regulator 1 of chromatin subfamily A